MTRRSPPRPNATEYRLCGGRPVAPKPKEFCDDRGLEAFREDYADVPLREGAV